MHVVNDKYGIPMALELLNLVTNSSEPGSLRLEELPSDKSVCGMEDGNPAEYGVQSR
jgi:hypothetical protein